MRSAAASLVVAALFGPDLTGASYRALVVRYAAGERAAAVAELGEWREKDLARELDRLRSWERRARQWEACEEKYTLPNSPCGRRCCSTPTARSSSDVPALRSTRAARAAASGPTA